VMTMEMRASLRIVFVKFNFLENHRELSASICFKILCIFLILSAFSPQVLPH
jgi:hypothetical protein